MHVTEYSSENGEPCAWRHDLTDRVYVKIELNGRDGQFSANVYFRDVHSSMRCAFSQGGFKSMAGAVKAVNGFVLKLHATPTIKDKGNCEPFSTEGS